MDGSDLSAIEALVAGLLGPLDADSRPNLGALAFRLRSLDALALDVKFFGYEIARRLAADLPPRPGLAYAPVGLASKACTQEDLESDWAAYWCGELHVPVVFHRKLWEYAYVLQAMAEAEALRPGARALGFGCGEEPIASLLAARGLDVTVTDLAPDESGAAAWRRTGQHLGACEAAYRPELVDRDLFEARVAHRCVDMNAIPGDLAGYDVAWSICALEHLGSIERGLAFVENAMATLRPGGVAVHTTEFNFLDDERTVDNWATVLPQRRHFRALAERLQALGHTVAPLDFDIGARPMDRFIDVPPFPGDGPLERMGAAGDCRHLKLAIDGFASTCFGLIVRKG